MGRDWRKIREQAGVSRDKACVLAGVSYPTGRIFEAAGPSAIKDERKREALVTTYNGFAQGKHGG